MTTALLTTADVARSRTCHPSSVARIARSSGIGHKAGRDWIFTVDEAAALEKLIRDEAGNPNFGKKSTTKNPRKHRENRGS
jgi:hypothetical protein